MCFLRDHGPAEHRYSQGGVYMAEGAAKARDINGTGQLVSAQRGLWYLHQLLNRSNLRQDLIQSCSERGTKKDHIPALDGASTFGTSWITSWTCHGTDWRKSARSA